MAIFLQAFLSFTYLIILLLHLVSFSSSLKFTTTKISQNKKNFSNNKTPFTSLRILSSSNLSPSPSSGLIKLKESIDGLCTLDIYLGEKKQKIPVLLDSGSSILWVTDNNCESCLAKNKFSSLDSNTFKPINQKITMNYITGKVSGVFGQDNIYIDNKIFVPDFNFALINKSDIDFELDGIIGLSKVNSEEYKNEFSFLKQLYEKNIIENNIFVYDIPNKNFYLGEIPSFVNATKNISCGGTGDSIFWSCYSNFIEFNSIQMNKMTTEIVFDTGSNCLIFPLNYKNYFNDVINSKEFLTKNKCSLKEDDDRKNVFQLICDKELDVNRLMKEEEDFLSVNLDENDKTNMNMTKKIGFRLIEVLEPNKKNFLIYFTNTPHESILFGIPFFEKFIAMFNQDSKEITIFYIENNNIIYERFFHKRNIFLKILTILIIIAIILLVVCLVYNIILRKKIQVTSNIIESRNIGEKLFNEERQS